MANPQLENGHIRIANELLEALARTPMSGQEWQVVVTLFRYTYGFNKKATDIKYIVIADHTGLRRQRVYEAIKSLNGRNIVTIKRYKGKLTTCINKDYETWKNVRKNVTVTKKRYRCNEKTLQVVRKNVTTPPSQPLIDAGLQIPKDNIKDNYKDSTVLYDAFELFWKAYPKRKGRKVGKQNALEQFKKLKQEDYQSLLTATKHYANETDFPKDAERFLKKDFWRDWIEEPEQKEKPKEKTKKQMLPDRIIKKQQQGGK